MIPPPGDQAAHGDQAAGIEVSSDAYVERLQRRNVALQRQLEARIAQVGGLQARLDERERAGPAGAAEVELLRARAAEYDALMATMTMRALRRPRAWYTGALQRFPALAGLRPGRH